METWKRKPYGLGPSVGPAYDQAVAAVFMTALAREEHAFGSHGRITQVATRRAKKSGVLHIRAESLANGELHCLNLQVFNTLNIGAANDDFAQALAEAQSIYKSACFDPHHHRYGFIVSNVSIDRFFAFKTILQQARSSVNGNEYVSRFVPGGETSWSAITLRNDLLPLLSHPTPDEECKFYSNFFARQTRGLQLDGARFGRLAEKLARLCGSPSHGQSIALELCQWAGARSTKARVWNREVLLRELGALTEHLRHPEDRKIASDNRADVHGQRRQRKR